MLTGYFILCDALIAEDWSSGRMGEWRIGISKNEFRFSFFFCLRLSTLENPPEFSPGINNQSFFSSNVTLRV